MNKCKQNPRIGLRYKRRTSNRDCTTRNATIMALKVKKEAVSPPMDSMPPGVKTRFQTKPLRWKL